MCHSNKAETTTITYNHMKLRHIEYSEGNGYDIFFTVAVYFPPVSFILSPIQPAGARHVHEHTQLPDTRPQTRHRQNHRLMQK